jgi:hypothetical protein
MKIGQKIVCVNDVFTHLNTLIHFQNLPKYGVTYTVRELTYVQTNNTYRVLLEEIHNKKIYIEVLMGKVEPGFDSKRFVPLDEWELMESEVNKLIEPVIA